MIVDVGSGPPLILIPGIQGRWEWMRPTVEALARRCRVVTFSLAPPPGQAPGTGRPGYRFDAYVDQAEAALRESRVDTATVCGVSYGGLIAVRLAATRPERVNALALVSTPSPGWRPGPPATWYLRAPRLLAPLFVLTSPWRLGPEILSAFPAWPSRAGFTMRHLTNVLGAPFRPTHMAARIQALAEVDLRSDCRRVVAPTLVIAGDPPLDRVVPVEGTREYLQLIAGAIEASLPGTGHIGSITHADRFAEIVADFMRAVHRRG